MCVRQRPNLGRIVLVFALVLTFTVAANAYTIVMRDGRRLEIPVRFELTNSTLTYEVSPGIQITLQLAAIDVSATEKANHEAAGSFLKRTQLSTAPAPRKLSATRTITNLDLESTAQRRRASELAYENRRKELGLPSVEESRRRAAEESEAIAAQLQEKHAVDTQNETYWRTRATELRTEMAAVDAQINYFRRQLELSPFPDIVGSYATAFTGLPVIGGGRLGTFRGSGSFGAFASRRPGVFVAPPSAASFGSMTRGRVNLNPQSFPQHPRVTQPWLPAPYFVSPGWLLPSYDSTYDRSYLITQFNQLSATRAGLNARWRELEDEARRAGAPPGWLRP
jgi:hypothetical protein